MMNTCILIKFINRYGGISKSNSNILANARTQMAMILSEE